MHPLTALAFLSLSAAALGLVCAVLVVSFLPGESCGFAGIAGLSLLLRSLVLRQSARGAQLQGWVLASVSVPFCVLLLPGGVVRLLGARLAPAAARLLSHERLRGAVGVRGNERALAAVLALGVLLAAVAATLHRALMRDADRVEPTRGGGGAACAASPLPPDAGKKRA
jgi:hypothetical protein